MAGGRPVEVQVQGPFETSYSLAQVNRRLAESLSEIQDRSVSIYATEGPGDYSPSPEDVAGMPEAALLYERAKTVPYPDVVIRQMWPPRLIDSTGGMTCEYFGWEESVVPPNIVRDFNGYLDGIGVFSNYVKDALRNSGVDVPIAVVGVGVDKPNPDARPDQPELSDLRSFRLLHISSAFPRKGVDVLLEAYFAEFSNADDISLILKTFPNPHNQVGRHLERLLAEHPDPPDVRWIDRDLETEEVGALYNLASCYVHPARGEGFGLPVAEAMAAGVPVIATSYSGLAEFVSDETAITIPYHVEPATSHVATPGSEWAEPDGDALRGLLRQSFESPHSIEIAQRVETAQALIADRFTWRATAQRWSDFVAELEESAQVPRVAMVSTWNSRCGIADYSRYIVENAKGAITYRVFADRNVETLESEAEWGVERSWTNRWTPDLSELDDALEWADPEIVHFQFNFAFFELQHLAALIEKQLPLRGVVVTLHRTSDPIIDGEVVSVGDIASTLRQVDKIIVHQQSDAERLRTFGITDNVSVIFHGAPDPPEVNGQEVKATIGLANRKVVGAFGFLLPHKGTLELLDAIDRLRTEIPDIHLLALCARHPDVISANFELEVRREILTRKLEDHVTLITDFLPDETIRAALTSADVIALPYRPTEESASGALRFILPVGKPVVATDLPIFADVRDALMLVEPDDSASLTASLCKVLLNDGLQAELAQRAQAAAQAFRWSLIVAQHREIYTTIRAKRQEASRALAQLVNG
jgi:glycosyltransferase involved in cell wall biosynthesis